VWLECQLADYECGFTLPGTSMAVLEAMIYLISRTVPEDLQPAVAVLAFAELPIVAVATADPGLEGSVQGALRVLERHGLIWDGGEQLVPSPHGMQNEGLTSST
jgi:hypothetical protein